MQAAMSSFSIAGANLRFTQANNDFAALRSVIWIDNFKAFKRVAKMHGGVFVVEVSRCPESSVQMALERLWRRDRSCCVVLRQRRRRRPRAPTV
jgi:hypothetical protein